MGLQAVSRLLCTTAAGLVSSRPRSSRLVSGWTPELSGAQRAAKCAYHAWVAASRPRNVDAPTRLAYKASKARFRVLLRANRCCQRDRFYSSLNMADSRKLFSKVRQLRGQSGPPTTQLQFDGCLFKGSSVLLAWA